MTSALQFSRILLVFLVGGCAQFHVAPIVMPPSVAGEVNPPQIPSGLRLYPPPVPVSAETHSEIKGVVRASCTPLELDETDPNFRVVLRGFASPNAILVFWRQVSNDSHGGKTYDLATDDGLADRWNDWWGVSQPKFRDCLNADYPTFDAVGAVVEAKLRLDRPKQFSNGPDGAAETAAYEFGPRVSADPANPPPYNKYNSLIAIHPGMYICPGSAAFGMAAEWSCVRVVRDTQTDALLFDRFTGRAEHAPYAPSSSGPVYITGWMSVGSPDTTGFHPAKRYYVLALPHNYYYDNLKLTDFNKIPIEKVPLLVGFDSVQSMANFLRLAIEQPLSMKQSCSINGVDCYTFGLNGVPVLKMKIRVQDQDILVPINTTIGDVIQEYAEESGSVDDRFLDHHDTPHSYPAQVVRMARHATILRLYQGRHYSIDPYDLARIDENAVLGFRLLPGDIVQWRR